MSGLRVGGRTMRFQAQAVLRRPDHRSPLRLAGVLLAGAFYPATAQDAWGPLHLEGGLVALAPLDPVEATDPADASALAMRQATRDWADGNGSNHVGMLSWRPIGEVRQPADGRTVAELLELMTAANEVRLGATPSTPPYHGAARELEDLASQVYDTASSEERSAEDRALERAEGDPTAA